jgi:hypothetical protein
MDCKVLDHFGLSMTDDKFRQGTLHANHQPATEGLVLAGRLLLLTEHWRIVYWLLDRPDEPVGGCNRHPTRSGCSEGAEL